MEKLYAGLDIGTSKIGLVAIDKSGEVKYNASEANSFSRGKEQDPDEIAAKCRKLLSGVDYFSLGVSGQMHGVLYVDKEGNAVSPLYTWQDEKGTEKVTGTTYEKLFGSLTGYKTPSGYGLTTHFYLQKNRLIPKTAVKLCTIGDYVAMKIFGRKTPLIHATNAASMGVFDVKNNCFDKDALLRAETDLSFLPEVTTGFERVAIGDNQASFIGATREDKALLVNIGTGSQISYATDGDDGVGELRPLDGKRYLQVYSAVCGGYSYVLLNKFFQSVLHMCGVTADNLYEKMNAVAENNIDTDLKVLPYFRGTREDSFRRAEISNLYENNFTAENLVAAVLNGIADELLSGLGNKLSAFSSLVGAGNGLRRNKALREIFENKIGLKMRLSPFAEEAAYGAALCGASSDGVFSSAEAHRR